MDGLFLTVLNMSFTASLLILAVLGLRVAVKKLPLCLLWALVALRLVCPFSIESDISLIPAQVSGGQAVSAWADDYIGDTRIFNEESVHYDAALAAGLTPVSDGEGHSYVVAAADRMSAPATVENTVIPVMSRGWLAGMAAMLLYALISYIRLRRQVATAVLLRDNIRQSEAVSSPFVLGLLRPMIYLPFDIGEQEMGYIIAHEQAHIRRRDHWWKPLAFLLLALHWFNPLVWLAYSLLCRDLELACDQRAIRRLSREQRAEYSAALLHCSVDRRRFSACPLAFGEVGVKERVKNVLDYKKPTLWLVILAILITAAVGGCLFTSQPREEEALPVAETEAGTEAEMPAGVLVNGLFVAEESLLTPGMGDYFSDPPGGRLYQLTMYTLTVFSGYSGEELEYHMAPLPVVKEMSLEDWQQEDAPDISGYSSRWEYEVGGGYRVYRMDDEVWLGHVSDNMLRQLYQLQPAGAAAQALVEMAVEKRGIDAPETVITAARDHVENELAIIASGGSVEYLDWRMTYLARVYTYDDVGGRRLDVYQMNYEWLPSHMEGGVLAGGVYVADDGWISQSYPYCLYPIYDPELDQVWGVMGENDCEPGDELFTSDLSRSLPVWQAINAAKAFLQQQEGPETLDTIVNFYAPQIREHPLDEIDALQDYANIYTEEYDADGPVWAIGFNTVDGDILGLITLYVDGNGTVFAGDYRN